MQIQYTIMIYNNKNTNQNFFPEWVCFLAACFLAATTLACDRVWRGTSGVSIGVEAPWGDGTLARFDLVPSWSSLFRLRLHWEGVPFPFPAPCRRCCCCALSSVRLISKLGITSPHPPHTDCLCGSHTFSSMSAESPKLSLATSLVTLIVPSDSISIATLPVSTSSPVLLSSSFSCSNY